MLRREHKVSNISSEAIFAIPAMKPGRVVAAIIFCLSLMLFDIKYETSKYLRAYSHDLLKPLSLLIEVPLKATDFLVNYFISTKEFAEQIKSLEEEIIKLKTTNKYLENVTTDNQQLNQLWDSAKTQRDNYFIAQKYSLSPNIFQPSLVLKIHNEQDIDKNDPVLTEEGLVGRVKERSFFNAEVLLVHDIRSIIPVISQKSQLQGTLKGNGLERHGTMQYVKKTSSFEEGEKLFTSGLGDIFPKGIEVGKIVSIKDPVDSNFLEIKVDFSQSPVNKNYFLIYKDAKL